MDTNCNWKCSFWDTIFTVYLTFQVSLIEGCQRILVSDCYGLLEKRVSGRQRGQHVDEEAVCGVCGGRIVRRGEKPNAK